MEQKINKNEMIHIILLCVSLFAIAFIFFSNTITKINVTVDGGTPLYVKVPAMFSMAQVVFLMILTFVAAVNFVYIYKDLSKIEKKTKTQEVAMKILGGDDKRLYKLILEKKEYLQKNLVYDSGFPKAKVTRILEKLEQKRLVTKKPFGNTNKIVLNE